MSLSKVSLVTARCLASNSTTWRRSGQVVAQTLPSLSTAMLLTRRFWSRLHCVKPPVAGSKTEMPLLVLT